MVFAWQFWIDVISVVISEKEIQAFVYDKNKNMHSIDGTHIFTISKNKIWPCLIIQLYIPLTRCINQIKFACDCIATAI